MVTAGAGLKVVGQVIRTHVVQVVFFIHLGAGTQDIFHLVAVNQLIHQLFFQQTVSLEGNHYAVT